MSKIALACIVKGSNEEAELLDRLLNNIYLQQDSDGKPPIDGVFITRTHKKGEEPNKAVGDTVEEFKDWFDEVQLSDFEWVNNFAEARNFNFAQVPKDYDYVMWSDADDIWRGLRDLRATIKEHNLVEAFAFNYLYDWDEFNNPTVVHRKTMIIKNDGCASWVGELHEDLIENRRIDVHAVEGIDRLHLTTKDRIEENSKRNLEIATAQAAINPNDPRSYWNLGNSRFGVSDFVGARDAFEHFLTVSESEDEKYLIYERLADVYKSLGNRGEAIKQLQLAIGLNPSLPDAYLQLAYLYFSFGQMDKAEKYCLDGMLKRPQTNKMIVYNPRDYDYNPMMLLARVYYEKNRPDLMVPLLKGCLKIYPEDTKLQKLVEEGESMKNELGKALEAAQELEKITDKEELKKAMDALPLEVRSHPAICVLRNKHFVKTESSGKDLVIYCGNTDHQWNPELFKTKGFGGSEEAVVHLAREWARLGWNVTVYNNCGHKAVEEPVCIYESGVPVYLRNNIVYRPFWEWNYRDKQDVTILWRHPKPLDAEINSTRIFLDVHDAISDGEFTEKRLAKLDKVFVKTKFHRSLFPSVPDEKMVIIPNGLEIYDDPSIKKDPMLVINTSSPDRSMDVLPKLWKRVKDKVPEAKMKWAYGWDVYKSAHADDPKKIAWMEETIKEIEEAGIESLGKIPQAEIGRLYQEASFFAYPTEFAEIDCISVKKAQAAKAAVIATDFGALDESIKFGVKIHSNKNKDNWNRPYQFHFGLEDEAAQDAWVDVMVKALQGKKDIYKVSLDWEGLDAWREQYEWAEVADRWNEILCG